MRLFVIPTALTVSLILSAGTMPPHDISSRFYEAIRNNDISAVRSLIRSAGVDVRDRRGTTPLMYAAAVGSREMLTTLISAGADVNAKNAFNATALLWCTGDLEKVRALLSKGATVNARSHVGRTPLLIAAIQDGNSSVVRLLLENGADVSVQDSGGVTPVEAAALGSDVETIKALLAKGALADAKDAFGLTALAFTSLNGTAEVARLLIQKGADVNAVSKDSLDIVKNGPIALGLLTPLQLATTFSNYEVAEVLLQSGARVDQPDVRGMTPLALAFASDHPDPRIVRLLLGNGANPNLKSRMGETTFDWARKYRDSQMLQALGAPPEQAGARPQPVAPSVTDQPQTRPAIRQAVEGSVALLQQTSGEFLQRGGCVACHAQNLTGMAVSVARSQGAKVNVTKEEEQTRNLLSLRGGLDQTLIQLVEPPPAVSGIQYTLLHLNASSVPASFETDAMVIYVATQQRKEGNWPNNESKRPPLADGDFATTARGIRCLRVYGLPGRQSEFDDRIERGNAWLKRATPITTEDRVMQLLGIKWGSNTYPEKRLDELLALQQINGGWAQTKTLPTDAYATGQVLYALHELGISPANPVYKRGVTFLLRTRLDDGSWHVKTRAAGFQPYFQSGFRHEHDQWISAAGTAWATMGLAYAIPGDAKPKIQTNH